MKNLAQMNLSAEFGPSAQHSGNTSRDMSVTAKEDQIDELL